jgi:hypothetical protein
LLVLQVQDLLIVDGHDGNSFMRSLSHLGVGAFLLAVVALPHGGTAADTAHPLDPATPPGPLSTDSVFQEHVPLLDRDVPVPSFTAETSGSEPVEEPVPAPEPVDHEAMHQGGHDASRAEDR